MALLAAVRFGAGLCYLGMKDSWTPCLPSRKLEVSGARRSGSAGVRMKHAEDENVVSSSDSSSSPLEVKGDGNGRNRDAYQPSRYWVAHPKPLSLGDLSISDDSSDMRIAFQGSPGAFSEAAALKVYPQCQTVPCEQFEVVFKAVELWLVDKAVLPIENTFSGSIHRNYDLLLSHSLHIVGEVQLPIDYCLMALPGVRKEKLRRVLSHPLALAQCEIALSKLNVAKENSIDAAGAAQFVSSNGLRDAGAIASSRAALLYGLNILQEKVQDNPNNLTRFLVLARDPIIPRMDQPFKTSIVFSLEEGPGVIFKALSAFAIRNINLTKLESRPLKESPLRVVVGSNNGTTKYFDYLFYIDFEASMADPRAQNAVMHLQEYSTFLRVLGSFPMDIFL